MRKVMDITEKLSMEENPRIKIKGEEIEVKADAKTMLQIMGLMKDGSGEEAAMEAYELLFTEKDRTTLDKMNLSFKDLMIVIQTAIQLAAGEVEAEGEAQTHTTT